MDGSYEFATDGGLERIPVPRFSLDSPYSELVIN